MMVPTVLMPFGLMNIVINALSVAAILITSEILIKEYRNAGDPHEAPWGRAVFLILKKLPLSLPMMCIGIGALLVLSPFSPIVGVNPLENRHLTERLTEFVVIISLMGAGLKLDRPVSWRG